MFADVIDLSPVLAWLSDLGWQGTLAALVLGFLLPKLIDKIRKPADPKPVTPDAKPDRTLLDELVGCHDLIDG